MLFYEEENGVAVNKTHKFDELEDDKDLDIQDLEVIQDYLEDLEVILSITLLTVVPQLTVAPTRARERLAQQVIQQEHAKDSWNMLSFVKQQRTTEEDRLQQDLEPRNKHTMQANEVSKGI